METIEVFRENGIVTVTMNRPAKKNAANGTMWDELRYTFKEIANNPDDRVMILTGAGGEFCSGADLSDGGARRANTHALASMRNITDVAMSLARIPQPTIAKVRGVAVGAGCNMALMCDLVVCSDTARFAEIFSKRGLSLDFGGSWVLPRRIGLHKAKELALFGDIISAQEAERIGLVSLCVADEDLQKKAEEVAAKLATGAQRPIRWTKYALNNWLRMAGPIFDHSATLELLSFHGPELKEGLASLREKRPPNFDYKV